MSGDNSNASASTATDDNSNDATDSQQQNSSEEIDSVRELNRLLESALRMGGEESGGGGDSSAESGEDNSGENEGGRAASWRLDTARRLSSLLTSHLGNNSIDEDNPILPALKRQTRYWTPLLLSWVRQDGGGSDDDDDANSPEVQIEALRALTALTAWTARTDGDQSGEGKSSQSSSSYNNNNSSLASSQVTAGCSSHTPLSISSQKLLLRHADSVPMIVSLLSSPDAAVHEQAAWIFGSIASGGLGATSPPSTSVSAAASAAAAEVTKAIKNGAAEAGLAADVSVAMPTPSSPTPPDLDDHDSRKDKGSLSARDAILAAGAMRPLLKCMEQNPDNVQLHKSGAWCLASLIEGRWSSSSTSNNESSSKKFNALDEINVIDLMPTLRRMLHMEDWEVLTFTCWTLSHLCDGPAVNINAVIYSENPIKREGEMFFCPDYGLNASIPDYTEIILELDAVPYLRDLVCHDNREIQKEACWTLSNIAAGTVSQIQSVIDSGAIPPLVDLVNDDTTDKEVRSEACWVVLNATSCGSDDQIETLVDEGCVSVLGVLLTESSMVMMALEGLERVLQTEEAKDAAELRSNLTMTGEASLEPQDPFQRQTILKCASLIKGVIESTHNSSAVTKRAKRIWETHFVSCALCHGSFSRHRIDDARFCNECKCHVCSSCDCRVYHLSYQEELWAEDEEKTESKIKSKKNKKAKKKERQKQIKDKKIQQEQQQKPPAAQKPPLFGQLKDATAKSSKTKGETATNASSESGDLAFSKGIEEDHIVATE
eukprot:g3038.t1 g3038   contig12:1300951-1303756(+)